MYHGIVPSINTSPQSIKLFLVVTEVQSGVPYFPHSFFGYGTAKVIEFGHGLRG